MTVVEITGRMLRAARSLTGLSQQEIADRARISRPSLTTWENSSSSVPSANARALGRVVAVLQAEGIQFRPDGVYVERAVPLASSIVHSEARA